METGENMRDGHLSDEALALYVDHYLNGTTDKVPEEIRNHLQDCVECKITVSLMIGFFGFLSKQHEQLRHQPSNRVIPVQSRQKVAVLN